MVQPSSARAPLHRAIVLGASLTGMLAAAVLADHADEVLVLERDVLPDGAAARAGLPQARHIHPLLSGGARAIESVAPGIQAAWLAEGARRIAVPARLAVLTPHGWIRRESGPSSQYQIVCTRDLLDAVARRHLLDRPRVTVRTRVRAESLVGDQRQVGGVRARDLSTGSVADFPADLVVDATGRGSRAPYWLAELGLAPVHEETVDPGLVYASRLFRAPAGGDDFPVVSLQADPREATPGRMAFLAPVERGRWHVTLAGTRGGEPTADPDRFDVFARQARHPLVADLIAGLDPLTAVHLNRSCSNRRRFFERHTAWPAGFVVLGDAVAAYNPVYGQGMSAAAQSVTALRGALRKGLAGARLAREVQRAVGRVVQSPWEVTTGQDILFPGATGRRPPLAARLSHGYMDRLSRTATSRPAVTRALFDVMSLSAPPTRLLRPDTALRVLLGPSRPVLTEPPLTPYEHAFGSGTEALPPRA